MFEFLRNIYFHEAQKTRYEELYSVSLIMIDKQVNKYHRIVSIYFQNDYFKLIL